VVERLKLDAAGFPDMKVPRQAAIHSSKGGWVGMRAVAIATCLALLLLTGGCRPIKIQTGCDPAADFSTRRTYAWRGSPNFDTGDPRFDSPRMGVQIREVVDSVLAAKGFERTDTGDPRFLIECVGGVGSGSSTVNRFIARDDSVQDWRWTGSNTVDYEKGMVVLNMSDPTTGRSLWRAVASGVLKKQADAAERRERLGEALREMLDRFPPQP
jgi:hypothetical protein